MELQNLSSNWKNLQKTLAKEKRRSSHDHGSSSLKRKGTDFGDSPKNTSTKRPRTFHAGSFYKSVKGEKGNKDSSDNHIRKTPRVYHAGSFPRLVKVGMGLSQSTEAIQDATVKSPASLATPKSSRSSFHDDDATAVLLKPLSEPFTPNLGFYPAADSQKHKYVALDCEMVGIGPPPHSDSQLARVSITNFLGDVLYDTYVQPVLPVTDYRTHVSGVTAAHLDTSSARPFKVVQDDVKSLLQGRILVGHAVKNDLEALIINHPKRDIRDTSRYPPYREISGGRTPALRRLASQFLGIKIQEGEHSSVVDARATMALFRREKDGFEKDNIRRFGVAKPTAPVEIDEEREELRKEKQRIRNKKKKKRRK